MAMTRGIIRMTEGGRVSMPHLYLTYKLPSRNAQIFRKYMTNKAYNTLPEHRSCTTFGQRYDANLKILLRPHRRNFRRTVL